MSLLSKYGIEPTYKVIVVAKDELESIFNDIIKSKTNVIVATSLNQQSSLNFSVNLDFLGYRLNHNSYTDEELKTLAEAGFDLSKPTETLANLLELLTSSPNTVAMFNYGKFHVQLYIPLGD